MTKNITDLTTGAKKTVLPLRGGQNLVFKLAAVGARARQNLLSDPSQILQHVPFGNPIGAAFGEAEEPAAHEPPAHGRLEPRRVQHVPDVVDHIRWERERVHSFIALPFFENMGPFFPEQAAHRRSSSMGERYDPYSIHHFCESLFSFKQN